MSYRRPCCYCFRGILNLYPVCNQNICWHSLLGKSMQKRRYVFRVWFRYCGCVTFPELLLVADIHYWRTQENLCSKLNTIFTYIESDMTFEKILVIFLSILLNVLCGKLWGSLVFIVSLELVLQKSLEHIFVPYIMLYNNC